MEKNMTKENKMLSLQQTLEFFADDVKPLPYHLDKERTHHIEDEEMDTAKVTLRSWIETGLLKLYGIPGKIEINDVPSFDDNFLKVTQEDGHQALYPYNDWIEPDTPTSFFSHRYPQEIVRDNKEEPLKRVLLPNELSGYDFDWQHSIVAQNLTCVSLTDNGVYIRTEGFAFITVQFDELDVLCRADSIDFEKAEEQLKDAICQKCGKLELKQHYRSWAVKMKEAGYNLNQAATEIRRIFDHYRTPYPTERTIRNHIQDIIPPKH